MSGRLIFTRQSKQDVDNHYVIGAGVGAKTTAVRRALKRRANNSQKEGKNGQKIWAPCVGFCPLRQRLPRPLPQYEIQFPVSALSGVGGTTHTRAMSVDPAAIIRILLPPGFNVSINNFEESWNGNFSKELLASWNEAARAHVIYDADEAAVGVAKEAPKAAFAIENLDSLAAVANTSPGMEGDLLTQLPSLKGSEVVIVPVSTVPRPPPNSSGSGQFTTVSTLGSWLQSAEPGGPGIVANWTMTLIRVGGLLEGIFQLMPVGSDPSTGAFLIPMAASGKFTIHRVR